MAVVNRKATSVSNADASPTQTFNPTKILGGRVKAEVGVIAVASDDSIGSTFRVGRVWSGWRVEQILLWCTAITGAAADVGLYNEAKLGGAAVDADFFATAVSLATLQQGLDVTHEAGGTGNQFGNLLQSDKTIWEALGLTSDPGLYYDVVLTLTAAATAAGSLKVVIHHLDGN